MSFLVAGISAGIAVVGASQANKAEKRASEIEKFQSMIDVEEFASEMSLSSYNATMELGQLESEQEAMASAMGKRTSGAGFQRTQEVGREDLAENIARTEKEVAKARKYGEVSRSAIDVRTKASQKTRATGAVGTGLLSYAKAFG